MHTVITIAGLTLREAQRRWLVVVGVLLGAAFVLVYTTGLWFIFQHAPCGPRARPCSTPFQLVQLRGELNMMALLGLYVANFLSLITAVLLPVDTLSGEIASGVTQTLAAKPIRRAEIVLGKWCAYWLLLVFYVLLTAGGVILAVWAVTTIASGGHGFVVPSPPRGLALMLLGASVMLTVSIAGGTRFSTATNGMLALGIFGLGFLGGWIEQLGVLLVEGEAGRTIVRNIGTVISLLAPADAMWRLAAYHMMPSIARDLLLQPFSGMYPPGGAMVIWAIGYTAVVCAIGVKQFNHRAL